MCLCRFAQLSCVWRPGQPQKFGGHLLQVAGLDMLLVVLYSIVTSAYGELKIFRWFQFTDVLILEIHQNYLLWQKFFNSLRVIVQEIIYGVFKRLVINLSYL